ncbi:MAG: hypothetical protein EU543_00110 [Promethearchaeota archaeon]|nr:MAG: hypothetical protein EU543_00110 [Candidatus Lokiarchaeota archaeon]
MKAFCYLTLVLAFIMFYNKDPTISLLILAIGIGLFLFIRARKKSSSGDKTTGYFSFRKSPSNQNMMSDSLLTFLMLEQLNTEDIHNSQEPSNSNDDSQNSIDEVEQIKQEVLKLLESEDL